MEKLTYKNVIIGFGKAGRYLAIALSKHGEESVIIEREQAMYGGTCPNVGCAPSKTLIVAGQRNFDFKEAQARRAKAVGLLHNGAWHGAADQPGVHVLDGVASFVDNHTVSVNNHGALTEVTGERIYINTGATPVIPDIPGVHDSKNVITSREALELDELPKNLVIIGAGYIGLEFAGMYNAFGSKVTVLEPFDKFIPREDDDVSAAIYKDLSESGIDFHLSTPIEQISDNSVTAGGKVYPADKILVATGRKPNLDDLNLSAAGVALQPNGAIEVDDDLKTTADNIWAMGDVRGGGQFYYLSTDDYRIVTNHLFGDGSRRLSDRTIVPYSVFITPTLSVVGLNEKAAQAAGRKYRLFKFAAAPIVRSKVNDDMRGMLKGLVDPETGEILGVTLYMEDSHEVINLVSLAMKMHTPYTVLRDQIFTHPTMGEGLNDLFQDGNEVKL